jgi:hypothetical protein
MVFTVHSPQNQSPGRYEQTVGRIFRWSRRWIGCPLPKDNLYTLQAKEQDIPVALRPKEVSPSRRQSLMSKLVR